MAASDSSIKRLLKKYVMDDIIRHVQPASIWKLMIVDSNSRKILAQLVKLAEILHENVTGYYK